MGHPSAAHTRVQDKHQRAKQLLILYRFFTFHAITIGRKIPMCSLQYEPSRGDLRTSRNTYGEVVANAQHRSPRMALVHDTFQCRMNALIRCSDFRLRLVKLAARELEVLRVPRLMHAHNATIHNVSTQAKLRYFATCRTTETKEENDRRQISIARNAAPVSASSASSAASAPARAPKFATGCK